MVHLTHLGRRGSTASTNDRPAHGLDLEAQRSVESNTSQNRRIRPHVQITEPSSASHVPQLTDSTRLEAPNSPVMRKRDRSDSMVSRASSYKSMRRRGRAETTNNVAYSAEEMGITTGWSVGQEPGIDTSAPAPPYRKGSIGEADVYGEKYHQTCEITCVDYSLDQIQQVTLDNDNLEEHLESPVPDWSQVRWINVNGLSWDVIRVLGNYRNLHPLAIEDLMNTRSRTKADWYPDHTFLVLPLQKLVNLEDEDDSDSSSDDEDNATTSGKGNSVTTEKEDPHDDGDDDPSVHHMNEQERRNKEEKHRKKKKGAISALISDIFKSKKDRHDGRKKSRRDKLAPANSFNKAPKVKAPWVPKHVRSLQRYHAGPNQDRTSYMERNAALSTKGLGVSVEQVSIFLCSDNTLISFFEYSAQDVEMPLLRRLQTTGTILRQSCDASMLMQSILDAIIDLAIPVTAAYQDTIGDLELEVLTDPDIHESKGLYILTCEISILRNAIAPVAQLMSALKDHKSTSTATTVIPPSRTATPASAEIQQIMTGNYTPVHHPTLHHAHSHGSHHHKVQFQNGKPLHRPTPGRPTPVASTKSFTTISTGVTISPLTITYLGDIEDHALLIRDSYDQMRRSADNLVDLIFNTVSAYQNESMKQLTVITCFFLPLTFLTGYFGMNFEFFNAVKENSDTYFWTIAVPVCLVVFMILLRDVWTRFFIKWANKALIVRGRRRRLKR